MNKTRIDDLMLVRYLYNETSAEENSDIQIALTIDDSLHDRFFELEQSFQDLQKIEIKCPSNWVTDRLREQIYQSHSLV